jgi:GGDEF domain-containing protein
MFSRITNLFKNYNELKYLAFHDSLTGLYNRNWLYKNINKINYKHIYFIDINELHHINKRGHIAGDNHINYVISDINKRINTKNDVLMRYAGDEFILFSNQKDVIFTNKLYSVGYSENNNNLMCAINNADIDMLNNKITVR